MRTTGLLLILSFLFCAKTFGNPPRYKGALEPVVVERGPHHRVWQTVAEYESANGQSVYTTNSYVELATGLHYQENGDWIESKAEIEVVNGAAVARQGQHRASFARNLNSRGAVELSTPEGKRFRSHILGLAYTDAQTLRTVLIAESKNSQGVILHPNQVYYEDAFEGDCVADVRFTYTIAGFEQDIILITAPPSPAEYGLNPETTRLEVLTEFIEAPEPVVERTVVRRKTDDPAERPLVDEHLDFGVMKIGSGHAFPSRNQDPLDEGVSPTGKTWERIEGRLFLIEQVDFDSLAAELGKLPRGARKQNRPASPQPGRRLMASLPTPAGSAGTWKDSDFARLEPRPGLVVDYLTLNGSLTNYVFRGDMTYWISGTVNLYGTTIIDGGAVIKFPPSSGVVFNVYGPVDCRTTPWHPAVFTGRDDNTVGEIISGSTGNPTGIYGLYAISMRYTGGVSDFHDLRVRYQSYGFVAWGNTTSKIRNVQVTDSTRGLAWVSGSTVDYQNILFYKLDTAFHNASSPSTNRVQHATFHRIRNFLTTSNYTVSVTNSLLISVTNNFAYAGVGIGLSSSDSGIFQTIGSGTHYLPAGSPYRDAGTTDITPTLLADLKALTTFPPQTIGTNIINNVTLGPFATRDTDVPDLGYHYDPADYLLSDIAVNGAVLTITNGAVIAIDSRGTNFGIRLDNGGSLMSVGSPLGLNRFVRSAALQELLGGTNGFPTFADVYPAPASPASLRLRFTDLPLLAGNASHFFQTLGQGTLNNVALIDSQVRGGALRLSAGVSNIVLALTNNLLDRVNATLHEYKAGTTVAFNNLFREGALTIIATNAGWTWKDNLFDKVALTNTGGVSFTHDYNAYVTNFGRLKAPFGANDKILLNSANYQQAYLGRYFLSNSTPELMGQGSLSDAGARGLYHYTTTTNQVKETNSVLDIGLHYVALNAQNQPIDTDSDGLPDYVEDANGNGIRDGNETGWTTADTDQDGRNDMQELNEGTDPLNPNSFVPVRLVLFDFDGTNCESDRGQPPCCHEVDHRVSWKGTAVRMTNGIGNGIAYKGVCDAGKANLSARQGTVRFWYKPDWTTAAGGPGATAALVHLGAYSAPSTQGLWCVALNSSGNQVQFVTHTNGAGEMNCYAPISWDSNRWHQVVVTYTPSNSAIYVDGVCKGTNNSQGVRYYPNATESASDFRFGFNGSIEQAKGTFDEVETFNYPLTPALIQSNYQYIVTQDTEGEGLPDIQENEWGTSPTLADTDGDGLSDLYELMSSSYPGYDDKDNDGLSDPSELYHDTDPDGNDTDHDGLTDGAEVNGFEVNGVTYRTNPRDPDMDDDGALDGEERDWGWNPRDPTDGLDDSDGDGMPAAWERRYGLDPMVNDAGGNPDSDGLSNLQEYIRHTNPNDSDTDDDETQDGAEIANGTDPQNPDTDGDGWIDGQDSGPDQDNDGLPDGWEVRYGLSPTNQADATAQTGDGDNLNYLQEYLNGTDPNNWDSDNDGLSDSDEVEGYYDGYVTNPLKMDTDGDGWTDAEEAWSTNPVSADMDYDGRTDREEAADLTSSFDGMDFAMARLGWWTFEDFIGKPALSGNQDEVPKTNVNVLRPLASEGRGIFINDSAPSRLAYWAVEPVKFNSSDNYPMVNINLRYGTVRFRYQPLWTSSTLGGGGPGHNARLIDVGSQGLGDRWSLYITPSGTEIILMTMSNGVVQAAQPFRASIQFMAGNWYYITFHYSDRAGSTNELIIDGQEPPILANNRIDLYPRESVRAETGVSLGSDAAGLEQAVGIIDDLETFNWWYDGSGGGIMSISSGQCLDNCKLYPIVVRSSLVQTVDNDVQLLEEDSVAGNIGWLSWNGAPDANTLAASLTVPDSCHYSDGAVNQGDWVPGKPGVSNSDKVKTAVANLVGKEIIVVVREDDGVQGQGSNSRYEVSDFARITIHTVVMTGPNRTILATYLGRIGTPCTNTPPQILPKPVPAQMIVHSSCTSTINLTVSDHEDQPSALRLSAAVTSTTNPDLIGTASITFGGTGANRTMVVCPTANEVGQATITVTVTDSGNATDSTTFDLTVAPLANHDEYSVNEDIVLSVAGPGVRANDTGEAGQTMTLELNTSTSNGALTLNTDGSFTYRPKPHFSGTDSFTYYVRQRGIRSIDPATVTIYVFGVNDFPAISILDTTPGMRLEATSPQPVAAYPALTPSDITMSRDRTRAFLSVGSHGLVILDVSNPRLPIYLGTYDTVPSKVAVSDSANRVHVAVGDQLRVLDIANPAAPTQIGSYTADSTIRALAVARNGMRAYLGLDAAYGLKLVDIAADGTLTPQQGSWSGAGMISRIAVGPDNNQVYVLGSSYQNSDNPFIVVNVQNPGSPTPGNYFDLPGSLHSCVAVSEDGTFALVGAAYSGVQRIRLTPTFQSGGLLSTANAWVHDVEISRDGRRAYVADSTQFSIIDLTQSSSMPILASRTMTVYTIAFTRDLTIAYTGNGSSPFEIFDIGTTVLDLVEDSPQQSVDTIATDIESPISWQPLISDNTVLLPTSNMQLSGGQSDSERTLTLTPAANQNGIARVTLTVHDWDADFTSEQLKVVVQAINDPPIVTVTAPPDGSFYPIAPTNVLLTATATDPDGQVTTVRFKVSGNLIHLPVTQSGSTYTLDWRPLFGGTNTITAEATDNQGATGTSSPITFRVNHPPLIAITAPAPGANFTESQPIPITASASDIDGAVTKVEFFAGNTPLATLTAPPWNTTWNSAPVGTHELIARATDNNNATRTSTNVTIHVRLGNTAPIVDAGDDQTIRLPAQAELQGLVTDDGLPIGSSLQILWTKVSGPGSVTFDNPNDPAAKATFSATGTYVLNLFASDSQLSDDDNVTITVLPPNQPPIVHAGDDQTLILAAQVPLFSTTNVFVEQFSKDSKGKEFWLAFPENHPANPLTLVLFITGEKDTFVNITISGIEFSTTIAVTANTIASINIPTGAEIQEENVITDLGIHVTSQEEVSVYGLNQKIFTTDAYVGLPVDILGTNYVVLGYPGVLGGNDPQLTVVGTRKNTSVTITPTADTDFGPAGQPFTIMLNAGQTFMLEEAPDLSGSLVVSDKPIAVFGGNRCTVVPPDSQACDHLVEQIPPVSTWGRNFVTMPLASRNGDTFRVVAHEDNTSVSSNAVFMATLNKGQIHEFQLWDPAHITSDKPILLAQYSQGQTTGGPGDPFMLVLPPKEQFLPKYVVSTPASGFASEFINIVCPTSIKGQVKTNGTAVPASSFVDIPGSGFSGAQVSIVAGSYQLEGPSPFGAFVYGFNTFDSYGYAGGMSLSAIAEVESIVLSPNPQTNQVNTTRCIFATVLDEDNNPLPGIRVDFALTGANAQTGFAFTEGNGIARFCYTGSLLGEDVIQVSVGSVSTNATNRWTIPFVHLAGTATDDGLPTPPVLNVAWSQSSGPGNVVFTPANATTSQATIPEQGMYVLRLTASDTELSAFDEMQVTAIRNQAPIVSAGPNLRTEAQPVILKGSANDDGLPQTPLEVQWSAVVAPGQVTFSDPSQAQTVATFKSPGTYLLRLSANDSEVEISSDVFVTNYPSAPLLACAERRSGALSSSDQDAIGRPDHHAQYYSFFANANDLLIFEMTSTVVDSFVTLLDSQLRPVASDDDSLGGNNAKLVYRVAEAGQYFIEASSSFPNQSGAYEVRLRCGSAPRVTIVAPADGTLFPAVPADIEITVEAFDEEGLSSILVSVNGDPFASSANSPFTTTFTANDPGLYTITAEASDNDFNTAAAIPVSVRVGIPTLQLAPAHGCPSLPGTHVVTGTLRDDAGNLVPNHPVAVTVTGANSASGSPLTDANGVATLNYTAANAGHDQIQASATVNSLQAVTSPAHKSWARPISCGNTLSGALATTDELLTATHAFADYFMLNAAAGDEVTITLSSAAFDTYLFLYDSACNRIASNDDFEGSDSRIRLNIPTTGTFLIEVSSFQHEVTGAYTLAVECNSPETPPEIAVFFSGEEIHNHDGFDFGYTPTGTPKDVTLVIKNLGIGNLIVDRVVIAGDFGTTSPTEFEVSPLGTFNFVLRHLAVTNGPQTGVISFFNNDSDGGDGLERPFTIYLQATANPPGIPPTVALTAPQNGLVATRPTNILISATASAVSPATILGVDFVVETLAGKFLIGRDMSGQAGVFDMTWNNPPANQYTLTAVAFDSAGRSSSSTPVQLTVQSFVNPNLPLASRDDVTVLANSSDNFIDVLRNDTDADPSDVLKVVEIDVLPENGFAEITEDGRGIRYTPEFFIRGNDGLRYIITDGRGGYDDAWVYIDIFATDMPQVTIAAPAGSTLTAGVPVIARATVTPADFVGKVEFFFNDVKIGEDTTAPYEVSWTPIEDPCGCGLVAMATDVYGQIGSAERVYGFIAPPGDAAPVAAILNLTNQVITIPGHTFKTTAVIREGLFELMGDAWDPDSAPVKYRIRLFTPAGDLVRDLTPAPVDGNGFRDGPVDDGSLGTLDFTLVDNGTYDLQLLVRAGFRQTNVTVRFGLETELKIGHLSFSEQDLVLPVNGFPLTITRTYNSLNTRSGDFGHSWTFSVNQINLEIDEERELTEALFEDEGDPEVDPSGQLFSLRVGGGRNVTLTMPNGRRTTFYYYLEPDVCNPGDPGQFCANPRWVAAPDAFASLRLIDDVRLLVLPGGLEWWSDDASSLPENYDFSGFILTTEDGTEFRIERKSFGEKTFTGGTWAGNYANVYGKGKLTQIKQRSLDTINIGEDTLGANGKTNFVITHKNPLGETTRSIVCQRDGFGRIVAISDPNGLDAFGQPSGPPVLRYDYARDNLIRVHRLVDKSDPLNPVYQTTGYSYGNTNFPHYITAITDPRGIQVARNLYDAGGRLIGMIDADGRTNHFHHDLVARTETITNRLGDRTLHVYDTRGNIVQSVDALGFNTFRGYDTNNNPTYEANHLNQTNWFAHSAAGLLVGTTNALGHTNSCTHNSFGQILTTIDSLGRGTTNSYDDKGRLTNVVNSLGHSTDFLYDAKDLLVSQRDALNNITTNQYDGLGNLTSTIIKDATGQTLNTVTFAYDANGNRTNQTATRTLPNGSQQTLTTTYIYDVQNRVIRTIEPDGKTNAIVYNTLGKQQYAIDKLGRTNIFEYDLHGRVFRQTYPDGTLDQTLYDLEGRRTNTVDRAGRSTTYIYDKLGRLTQTIFPDNATNIIVYDAAGRVAYTVSPRGTTNAFGYDAAGQRTSVTNGLFSAVQSVTRYSYDALGNLTNTVDASGRATDYEYDVLNRRIKTVFPATIGGESRAFVLTADDALGRRLAETNEAGIIKRFGYDGIGRLTAVTNAWGTADATWATYAYDEVGNQTNQVDALGRMTRFEFDNLGRRVKRILPGDQAESFGYDAVGNLLAHTNFITSQVTTNEYDAMNRLVRRWSGTTLLESYEYSTSGQRANRTDASGNYAWGYDERDRVTLAVTPVGMLFYKYDASGNVTNLHSSTPNGVSLAYEYDALNRVTNVIDKRLTGAQNTAYKFDAVGNLAALRYPNAVTNIWQFDTRNRLTNILWGSSAEPLAHFKYRLDVTGHRTNLIEDFIDYSGTRVLDYAYDTLHRLTNEVVVSDTFWGVEGQLGYQYSAVGNRGSRTGALGPLGPASSTYSDNDWLTTDVYDNNGNTRTSGSVVYLYDWANRLTNVNNGAIVIVYNADGHRIKKTANGVETLYLVDDRNLTGYAQVFEELTLSSGVTNLSRAYTYGLDLISQRQASGTTHFYGYDGLGSVRFLSSSSGNVGDLYAYDAYGTLVASTGNTPNLYRYTGEQFDPDLGFYFLRARYLNPNTGRFWTMDSHEGSQNDPLSLHKYLYAHANPANMVDPTGHFTMTEILANTRTILDLATRVLNAMHKVWKIKKRLDTVKTIIEYAQKAQKVFDAVAANPTATAVQTGLAEAISDVIGDTFSLTDLAGGIDAMFTHLTKNWDDISAAILAEIPTMVTKLTYRIVESPQRFSQTALNTKDRGISFELPSQPIGTLPRIAKRFRTRGGLVEIAGLGRPGRIIQLGFFTGEATTVEPLIGIHYALHAPPGSIAPQTIVHYHIWKDPQRHIPGQQIWP